jgi:hypothetical protein
MAKDPNGEILRGVYYPLVSLTVVAALSYWLWGFEVAVLAVLVAGFTAVVAFAAVGAVHTNVQLSQIQQLLERERRDGPETHD